MDAFQPRRCALCCKTATLQRKTPTANALWVTEALYLFSRLSKNRSWHQEERRSKSTSNHARSMAAITEGVRDASFRTHNLKTTVPNNASVPQESHSILTLAYFD